MGSQGSFSFKAGCRDGSRAGRDSKTPAVTASCSAAMLWSPVGDGDLQTPFPGEAQPPVTAQCRVLGLAGSLCCPHSPPATRGPPKKGPKSLHLSMAKHPSGCTQSHFLFGVFHLNHVLHLGFYSNREVPVLAWLEGAKQPGERSRRAGGEEAKNKV